MNSPTECSRRDFVQYHISNVKILIGLSNRQCRCVREELCPEDLDWEDI
ncbi:MAG: hypothetical protein QOE88_410 [Verrucomicrobiota bacterium]|nr:hypothetical protein [Verrucomicrobiota bacterium]